ncbi:MAG: NAD(P)/FAD-dependent oxidoreductase [Deltaproteobacteria bacterium]|nr:NAD(P)/FAD-dependent oxidoreductase [Deltaproteobacteria bacterium]
MSKTSEKFDAIVIGGGLAGLSCAALLAKAGLSVLLLEKNRRLGGYAVSYTIKGHRFDIAIQAIGGCGRNGIITRTLKETGQENKVNFLPFEPARVYFLDGSDSPWAQAGSWNAIINDLCARFPGYAKEIQKCYNVWSGILAELERIASDENSAFGFSRSYPLLARYSGVTLEQFLDEQPALPDILKSHLAARSGYCMLPPRRLSLTGFACTEMSYKNGAWLIEGGVERLTKVLANAVLEQGGRIKPGSQITSIVTKDGKVRGVKTKDGLFYSGGYVVAASAARPVFEDLLDRPDLLSVRYREKLSKMETTGSYYIAYYSLRSEAAEGLWPNIEVRIMKRRRLVSAWSPPAYYILIPSMVDPSAAPSGYHSFCLSLPCPYGCTLGVKGRRECRTFLEREAEDRFPQLKRKLRFLFELGPEQLATISGNPFGSAYGWALTPGQSDIKRLNIKTPVPGLYLAGHWTMPGGGIAGAITSGRLCAGAVLKGHLGTRTK